MDRLFVKNFGVIKSVNLEIKDLVVFIGRQSSGKSTLSKLIAIFKDKDFLLSIKKSNDKLSKDFFKKYGISSYFKNNSYIKFETENYYVEYSYDKFVFKLLDNFKKANSFAKNNFIDTFVENFDPKPTSEAAKEALKQILNSLYDESYFGINFGINSIPIYIPAERIFVSSLSIAKLLSLTHLQVLSESMYNFAQMYYEAIENIDEVDLPVFDIKFKNDKENSYIIDKEKIKLSESASGYQSLIPTLLLIDFYKKTKDFNNTLSKIYVFEEPELNIFPDYQHKLVKHLVKKCLNTNTPNSNKGFFAQSDEKYRLIKLLDLI